MAKSKSALSAKDWIAKATPDRRRQCWACSDAAVRSAIAEFAAAKSSGATTISWMQFWREYLCKVLGWKGSDSATMNHVRKCLGVKTR